MQPWKQRLADEVQAPKLSGLQKLTLMHECETTHRHKHSWPLWGHQTWQQQHLHLIFRNTRRYQNPQGEQRNCRKQTRFLVASDLQQSLNPAGKTQQTHITIHLCLSPVERETRPSGSHPETLDLEWDSRLRANTRSGFSWNLKMHLKNGARRFKGHKSGSGTIGRYDPAWWPLKRVMTNLCTNLLRLHFSLSPRHHPG